MILTKSDLGCNELLFNPIAQWWRRGPIAHQIHKFMWSNAPMHYKISMLAYMFSYCEYSLSVGPLSIDIDAGHPQTVLPRRSLSVL